ncbi:MAG: FAD-dependent oxidoreductase [Candidatus Dormibacteraeota bacterium]|nr:FAD-dependent oxidoreductase [Candidatus Dormibacteraeota bacterium]
MTAQRVAVVGAGLAGLSAALELKRAGAHVEVFERMRMPGGKATSFIVDGVEVDNGQHVTLACCTDLTAFIDTLGMSHTVRMQPRFEVTVLARGHAPSRLRAARLPAPLHLMPSFLRYPHLTLRDKLRVSRALVAARRDRAPQGDMATWLAKHGQSAAARTAFWDPFLVPALNAPLDESSAVDGLFVIRTAFVSDRRAARIGYTTVPLVRIAEAAAARVDALHLRTAVIDVEHDGRRASALRTESQARPDFDAYVLALPPQRLRALDAAQPQRPFGIDGLDAFRTQPIVDVHLWYPVARGRVLGAAGFAALLGSPVQWVFEKAPGYLCCSLSAAGDAVRLPESELVARCHAELAAVLPALQTVEPKRGAATRDPDATFVPAPGLRRPGPRTALGNVVIAGAWTDTGWPATMESAVRSGRAAARAVLDTAATGSGSTTAAAQELAHAV